MSSYYDSELDRKSSRGMIYENEELRLRTININAEVERGQSDIKRLRRENEQLRREIWTLRDECDRLNKRFKAKLVDQEHGAGGCSVRGSGGSGSCPARGGSGCGGGGGAGGGRGCDGMHSNTNSDDSDSCDTCRGDDDRCSDNCSCHDSRTSPPPKAALLDDDARYESDQRQPGTDAPSNGNGGGAASFDHLSVVSEETMSNSEVAGSQMMVPSTLMGQVTPLTPIELVANQLNDLQAMVPPLSYFENILQQHMGSTIGDTPESASSSSGGKIIRHTNGWDYNMESPFAERKLLSSSSSSSANSRATAIHQQSYAPPTLSTFAPAHTQSPQTLAPLPTRRNAAPATSTVETVAITTMPPNAGGSLNNSPKHFFAPLKPRLKLNTSLANKTLIAANIPVVPTAASMSPHQHCEPPDIFVANALASPYQRQPLPTITVAGRVQPQPSTPEHVHSSQVSPRHRHRPHAHHQPQSPTSSPSPSPSPHRSSQQHHQSQITITVVDVDDGGQATAVGPSGAATPPNNASFTALQLQQAAAVAATTHAPTPTPNTYLTKTNEPIYATAQKCCKKLISASAVTMPLMTATTDSTKQSPFPAPPAPQSPIMRTSSTASPVSLATLTTMMSRESATQTDSVNLEAILNDIETISEDILAIQLEKGKSRENLNTVESSTADVGQPLQPDDKNKKPYRSEMNLQLMYDGTNSTITPTTSPPIAAISTTATTTASSADNGLGARTRSLEREHTESPSPHVPDPMAPFPDNRTYIGFDQLNKAATASQKPPLPPPKTPGTPQRTTPPLPPTRKYSPPYHITAAAGSTTRTTPGDNTPYDSPTHGLAPNKSHLFAAIANAAAKRAQFRSATSQVTKSLDVDFPNVDGRTKNSFDSPTHESSDASEAARRKARHVSIVCGIGANGCTNSEPNVSQTPMSADTSSSGRSAAMAAPTAAGSCTDLSAMVENPTVKSLRQTSQSTPNSPHSARRRSNSNGGMGALAFGDAHPTLPTSPLAAAPATSAHQQHAAAATAAHNNIHGHSQSQGVLSSAGAQHQQTSSQDSTRDLTTTAAAAAMVARSKCSRRHSDGTVASGVQRISGASSGGHHHHHQHHQHHQHQHSSVVGTNAHHSHHSHQDSNQETGTSVSDRNSNSLASSRESSTSFSMRSQRRKISISSHTGGKIPWCGCWGNGCL